MDRESDMIVMKFGSSVLTSLADFTRVAKQIASRKERGDPLLIVVSAMGSMTDKLLSLSQKLHPSPPKRERDMLVSVGERISMTLLAIALQAQGIEAMSFTGSQAGVITSSHHGEAKIVDLKPHRLLPHMQDKVVIIAGFQGVSQEGEVTTLGRGGSDTTAVALAAFFRGSVEFYKDVKGIYPEDPKGKKTSEGSLEERSKGVQGVEKERGKSAIPYRVIGYKKALEIANEGHSILQPRAIHLAEKNRVKMHVLSLDASRGKSQGEGPEEGTWIYGKEGVEVHQNSIGSPYEGPFYEEHEMGKREGLIGIEQA